MRKRTKQAIKTKKTWTLSKNMQDRLSEGFFLLLVACSVFLLISLISYHEGDPGWSTSKGAEVIQNSGGRIGAFIADIFLSFFGVTAFLFPIGFVFSSWLRLESKKQNSLTRDWLLQLTGWFLLLSSLCGLISMYFNIKNHWPAGIGGLVGDIISHKLLAFFNHPGSSIFLITLFFIAITLISGFSWLSFSEKIGAYCQQKFNEMVQALSSLPAKLKAKLVTKKTTTVIPKNEEKKKIIEPVIITKPAPIVIKKVNVETPKKVDKTIAVSAIQGLPPLSLLQDISQNKLETFTSFSLENLSSLVEARLLDFGVEAKVMGIYPGPIITRFELDLAPGIKVSKIVGLAKDIARSLSTVSVRIVEVIPGKSYIGLEIPNEHREMVGLKDILSANRYKDSNSMLSLALGKDIAGTPFVVDLTRMPHLLVAGTTGSGKSVSLNTMLLSFLYKATPKDLRLILIDPKMLELSVYEGIPHLLTPVITDMKDAANSLRWCVAEMDKRYRLMASLGVRNITTYNEKILQAQKQNEPLYYPDALIKTESDAKQLLTTLPLIVVVIDELADMMMVVGKKVEDLITRLAQKARASGIHLILATQRPSVDVITGLIKANIPTRIAFQVSSRIDSRTILDQQGAEHLLGQGDMLYLPPGAGIPVRVHGAYVTDDEVHRVVAFWRQSGKPAYLEEVTRESEENATAGSECETDALYDDAVKVVMEARRASISLVQRRLRIGYNRAARLMEEMEARGIVSSMDHSGGREVLIGEES